MATIRDVAEAAKVSLQTVSNVIHRKNYVTPETKQRVETAIAQLNYRPSRVAQSMRRQSSHALGFIVADPNPRGLADPFYGEVLAGMLEAARAHTYSLLIDYLPSDKPLSAEDFLMPFQTRQVDAAVVFISAMVAGHTDILASLARTQTVFAVLERDAEGDAVYSVQAANYDGAHAATRALINAGHRQIAFLDSAQHWPSVDLRWQGYQAAMQAHGLEAHITAFTSPDWTAEGGAQAAQALLAAPAATRPTAILAATDLLAVGAMQVLKAHGLRIPTDVAVIGFDDFEFARYVDPPLTTVRLPVYEMGKHAAEFLIAHLQGRPSADKRVVLPTELVIRQSSQ